MNGKERLDNIQSRLEALGIRDVKFTLGPEAYLLSTDVISHSLADSLDAYLNGDLEQIDISKE